jgi:signal peptidase II
VNFPSVFAKWAGSRALAIGYLLLGLSLWSLDHSTKHHAEATLLTWSHPTDVLGYRSERIRVVTVGTSPSQLSENGASRDGASWAWLDLNLNYVRNPGAAWGRMPNASPRALKIIFLLTTMMASVALFYLLWKSQSHQKLLRVGAIAIFAGAMGNLADRLQLGYVIDWLHLHWKVGKWQVSFPVFNAADVFVNFGIVLLLLAMILEKRFGKDGP